MRKLLLMLAVVGTAICSVGCSEETTIKLWHEFSYSGGNVSGDAYTYIAEQFANLQEEYYQVNTTAEEATKVLANFCSDIESGVESAGYEIVGDGIYAEFSVINPATPDEAVSTQQANFTKTRDARSYAEFNLTLHSPKGDGDAIDAQLQQLSFYSLLDREIDGDDITYKYIYGFDVDSDYSVQWVADQSVVAKLGTLSTYRESQYVFSAAVTYTYYCNNEESGFSVYSSANEVFIDSPSLRYYPRFTQSGNGSYPAEFVFTLNSEEVEAPYFEDYTAKADGVAESELYRRAGDEVVSADGSTVFKIGSTTEATMIKYKDTTVSVTYEIGARE